MEGSALGGFAWRVSKGLVQSLVDVPNSDEPLIPDAKDWFAQDELEFATMLAEYLPYSDAILEIGSRYGESLLRMAHCLPKGSRIVSVDLGQDPFSPRIDTRGFWKLALDRLRSEGYDVHGIEGDSHDKSVIARVLELGPFGFTFVDGDHTTEGVLADRFAFGHASRFMALHDILGDAKEAWRRIKEDHIPGTWYREIVNPRTIRRPMGIGVLL